MILFACCFSFALLLYFCFVAFVCFLGSCVCVYQRHRLLAGAGGLTEFDCSGATGQQWMLRVLCRETKKYKSHWMGGKPNYMPQTLHWGTSSSSTLFNVGASWARKKLKVQWPDLRPETSPMLSFDNWLPTG